MWQFAGGGTYCLSMKMGEREVANIQVISPQYSQEVANIQVIIIPAGVDRDTEPKPYRLSPQLIGW